MIFNFYAIFLFGSVLSHVKSVSLAGTMFLPNNNAENPYFDEELELLIQNTSISKWHDSNKRQASKWIFIE